MTLLFVISCYLYFARHVNELFPILLLLPLMTGICFLAGHSPQLGRLCHVLFGFITFIIALLQIAYLSPKGIAAQMYPLIMGGTVLFLTLRSASKLRRTRRHAAKNKA